MAKEKKEKREKKGFGSLFGFGKMTKDMGIDLGTANTLVYIKGQGIVVREPSVVAIRDDSKEVLAVGEEAKRMIGRTPGNIKAIRPMKDGVIADFDITQSMLTYFIQKSAAKKGVVSARIAICVQYGVTEVEKKAIEEAAQQAGAKEVFLIEEPMAAAIGAGLRVEEPEGNMVVDIGGGTSDIAVISLGGTVVSTSIKVAGDDFDDAIVRYMRKKHNLLIGDRTAEEIKIGIGTCFNKSDNKKMEVRGRNLVTGLPKTIEITSEETEEALKDVSASIVEAVHRVLEQTPPELAADIAVRGIVLTGGGCLLHGLDQLIESKTGINTMTAEDPMTVVAIGTGQYLDYIDEAAKEKIN